MVSFDGDDFLSLAARKLDWIDQRSQLLAGNIANADTPGYVARDLSPFASASADFRVAMARTNPADLTGDVERGDPVDDDPGERSVDGNNVSLDRQMRLVAENDQDQRVVTTLYKRYVGMTELALGASG